MKPLKLQKRLSIFVPMFCSAKFSEALDMKLMAIQKSDMASPLWGIPVSIMEMSRRRELGLTGSTGGGSFSTL